MVFEKIGTTIKESFNKIKNTVIVDENLINEILKDIQKVLIRSDVNVKIVLEFTKKIKNDFYKSDIPPTLNKRDYLIKIIYDNLVVLLGGDYKSLEITKKPHKILLLGLYGSGKTTTVGKMGKLLRRKGYKPLLVSLDTFRPAAYKQLETLAKSINVDVFGNPNAKDPIEILKELDKKDLSNYDIIVYDTAGRDSLNQELQKEIEDINDYVKPDDVLLVISADLGQSVMNLATSFHETCNVNGIIITKMDGTSKGGGAISACALTGAKVKYIGVGEKIDDLEVFEPNKFIEKLLGLGDLEELLERASEAIDETKAKEISEKMLKGEFTLLDLYDQLEAVNKMGSFSKIISMIPGMSSTGISKEDIGMIEGKMGDWKIVMTSCTKKELEDPEIIDQSRIDRISIGSGISKTSIRELMTQYRKMKKMIKYIKPNKIDKMENFDINNPEFKKMLRKMRKR
ncbi:MAG: signal recognition particle receptor subunit alpha [Candidatus Nanoarchaeia archaeon]|nr:signal recognition particle receptor subunit alpha [Candidatus Nanoarchaeia archaeon]